jgi:hypothetical protein
MEVTPALLGAFGEPMHEVWTLEKGVEERIGRGRDHRRARAVFCRSPAAFPSRNDCIFARRAVIRQGCTGVS